MRYRLPVTVLTILGFSCKCLAVPVEKFEGMSGTTALIHHLHTPADLAEHGVYPPPTDAIVETSTNFSSPLMTAFSSSASRMATLATHSHYQVDKPTVPSQLSVLPFHVQMAPARQDSYRRWRRRDLDPHARVVIAFEILGGLLGTIILILCGRSIRHYCRMPRRDLASEHIDRYYLERELADLKEVRLRINTSISAPALCLPPPYREAPLYEEVMKELPSAALNERRGS